MARLTDPEILRHYRTALSNYRCTGYVLFSPLAEDWLRAEIPGLTERRLAVVLYRFVLRDGEIDQVAETRPEWSGRYAYHYDLRLAVPGRSKLVYVETRLDPDHPTDKDNPVVWIVNIHDA